LGKKYYKGADFTFRQSLIAGVLEKRDSTFLNQKSSQSPFSKRGMCSKIRGLPRRFTPRNDKGMGSRLRGNDIKRGAGMT